MTGVAVGPGTGQGYAGDLDAAEAWRLLEREPEARLVDVRTSAEWAYVGMPDLAALGKKLVRVSWQTYPTMSVNQDFEHDLIAAGIGRDAPIVFLCRSGARSKAAAIAMTGHGYSRCYNLKDGFEGPLDAGSHRGSAAGWKAAGLPWTQS